MNGYNSLREAFKDYKGHVDVDYNRRIIDGEDAVKELMRIRELYPDEDFPDRVNNNADAQNKVIPDIVFHNRKSSKKNFLVIQVKTTTYDLKSPEVKYDRVLLRYFTIHDYHYDYGAFIYLTTGKKYNRDEKYLIELYKNGEKLERD